MSNIPFVICLIDDDEIYQYTALRIIKLSITTQKVLTFSDGEKAIHYLTENLDNVSEIPDVIFLDINMPIMDGWLFIEEYIGIKPKIGKKVIIYMLSSSIDKADIDRASKIGEISDYIVKPITPEKLKEIVKQLEIEKQNA